MSYLTVNMWPRTNKLFLCFNDRCGSLQFCQMPLIFWMLIVTIILTIAEHLEKPCVSWWIQHQGKKFVMCSFHNDLMALIVMIDTQIGTLYSLMYVYFAFLRPLYTCYDTGDDGKANLLIENRLIWKDWMVYKDQYMLEPGVFFGGKHFMVLMHLSRRSPLARPATVCQNGAVYVVGPEKTRNQSQRRRRRSQRTGKHQSRYMLLKILKELKVLLSYCTHHILFICV